MPYYKPTPSTGGGATVGGTNTMVQFNNSGTLDGATNILYDKDLPSISIGTLASSLDAPVIYANGTNSGNGLLIHRTDTTNYFNSLVLRNGLTGTTHVDPQPGTEIRFEGVDQAGNLATLGYVEFSLNYSTNRARAKMYAAGWSMPGGAETVIGGDWAVIDGGLNFTDATATPPYGKFNQYANNAAALVAGRIEGDAYYGNDGIMRIAKPSVTDYYLPLAGGTLTGPVTCSTTFSGTGAASFANTMYVQGVTTHIGAVTCSTTFSGTGAASFANTMYVQGVTTHIGAVTCSNGLSLTGTINGVIVGVGGPNGTSGLNMALCVGTGPTYAAAAQAHIAIGNGALNSQLSGTNNIGIGRFTLLSMLGGSNNVAISSGSLKNAAGLSIDNIGIGYNSLAASTAVSGNVAIGTTALSGTTTGHNNVAVGYNAGSAQTSGTNNIYLGFNAQSTGISASNQITLGNSSHILLRCQVTTITALSDRRDKTDIVDIPYGLDFINDLKPVHFTWNMRDGGQVGNKSSGFIAQDVLETVNKFSGSKEHLNVVDDGNPDRMEVAPGAIIPVLVQAIKDLKVEVEALKSRLNGL